LVGVKKFGHFPQTFPDGHSHNMFIRGLLGLLDLNLKIYKWLKGRSPLVMY